MKIKINPAALPKPQFGTPKAKRTSAMSKEAAIQVTDYFRDHHKKKGKR